MKRVRTLVWLFGLLVSALAQGPLPVHAQAEKLEFSRDIRPILSNNCFKCHGPDENDRKAELRLDDRAAAIAEAESGAIAIVPSKPDESELVRRIFSTDPDEMMPPPASNKHLTDMQKKLLRDWIAAGAEYKPHWAFVTPIRPKTPEIRNPKNQFRNPIDAFIAARLDQEHLAMSSEADRYTLVRRVYLDLIGLPPTPEEADAFVNDKRADAYERLVDQLLASPHYGERWARRWLDLARYADTNGYEKDRQRSMWLYRDWVIKALNDDMPFDQFTIRQIAGDMLPGATMDDIVATGFHRNTMLNEEGGIDPQEFRFYSNVDRVGTTGTTWLGLTIACAQCHTHKYDPLVHKEFYSLLAFFDEADEPMIDVPQPDLAAKRAEIEKQIAAIEADLPNRFPMDEGYTFTPLKPRSAVSAGGATLATLDDAAVLVSGPAPETDTYTLEFDMQPGELTALRIEALADAALPSKGPGRTPHGNFVLSGLTVTAAPSAALDRQQPVKFVRAEADFSQQGYTPDGALDSEPRSGWAIHEPANPNWNTNRAATFYTEAPVKLADGTRLTVKLDQQHGTKHTLGKFRVSLGKPVNTGGNSSPEERRGQFVEQKFNAWAEQESKRAVNWTVLRPEKMSSNLPFLEQLPDGSVLASGDQTKLDVYELSYLNPLKQITAIRLEALPHESLPAGGPGRVYYEGPRGDFVLSDMAMIAAGAPLKFAGVLQSIGDAKGAVDDKTDTSWSINGGQGNTQVAIFKLAQPLSDAAAIELKMTFEKYYAAALGRFRISVTDDARPIDFIGLPADVEAILRKPADERSKSDREQLFKHWLSVAPELAGERGKIDGLRKQLPAYPTTLVFQQRKPEQYRQTPRRHRGEFLQPKEVVPAGVPAILSPLPADVPRDRLALAKWLVDRNNPLTARVTMNRQWAAIFGRGLVRTTEDFGTQGELPTHPELLDWLAVEFMESGWSLKHMHRLMVTSATYRQTSRITPELLEHDPLNKLLARGPRVRLEAELVRDSVLRASGLLSEKMNGPSVFPPQPPSITTEGTYGPLEWKVSQGEDRHRRSLYTFAKRTAPFAMLATFDGPSGEACVARRDVSNTPLQALTLLNDAMFLEATQAFGRTYVAKTGSVEDRASDLFRRCLTRPPQPEELAALVQFFNSQRGRFANSELDAKLLAGDGPGDINDRAAWTALARAILNVDEMVVKK